MKKKINAILIILSVIALGASVALLTKVSIPSAPLDKIALYTRNKPNAMVSVAVIRPEETIIKAYEHDGREIAVPKIKYELGSITKTFTGVIAAKAISEEKLTMATKASDILGLDIGIYSPTISELLTHTSAYGDYSPSGVSTIKLAAGRNPFGGFDENDLVRAMNSFRLNRKPNYFYSYSDFGTAVLGSVISKVYDTDYVSLLTDYVQNELGLTDTYITVSGSLPNGWSWHFDDAYIASDGLVSNINDMVKYADMYLTRENEYMNTAATPLVEINQENNSGYLWGVSKNGVLEQSGETSHYSSHIIIDRNRGVSVIVLSNYRNDRYGDVSDIAKAIYNSTIAG